MSYKSNTSIIPGQTSVCEPAPAQNSCTRDQRNKLVTLLRGRPVISK